MRSIRTCDVAVCVQFPIASWPRDARAGHPLPSRAVLRCYDLPRADGARPAADRDPRDLVRALTARDLLARRPRIRRRSLARAREHASLGQVFVAAWRPPPRAIRTRSSASLLDPPPRDRRSPARSRISSLRAHLLEPHALLRVMLISAYQGFFRRPRSEFESRWSRALALQHQHPPVNLAHPFPLPRAHRRDQH